MFESFSHRPLARISCGMRELDDGQAAICFALRNPKDKDNRVLARKILRDRLDIVEEMNSGTIEVKEYNFPYVLVRTNDFANFSKEFKEIFKPNIDESKYMDMLNSTRSAEMKIQYLQTIIFQLNETLEEVYVK